MKLTVMQFSPGAVSLLAATVKAMTVVAVPEPNAIPEFFACVLGIGYLAWRRKRKH